MPDCECSALERRPLSRPALITGGGTMAMIELGMQTAGGGVRSVCLELVLVLGHGHWQKQGSTIQ